jgi:hypothetical protein
MMRRMGVRMIIFVAVFAVLMLLATALGLIK